MHTRRRERTRRIDASASTRACVRKVARRSIFARVPGDEQRAWSARYLEAERLEDIRRDAVRVREGAALVATARGGKIVVEADWRVLLPERLRMRASIPDGVV